MLIYTVIVASFLVGVAIGGLLSFRHWRTGMLALAATCAGVALIMVVIQIAEGGRTTDDVLTAAGLAFSPVVGTVLACVIIGTARLLWGIARRILKAIWSFGRNVLTDILHLVKRSSDQECRPPWTLSTSSRRSLKLLFCIVIILILLNIGTIWNLATRIAPRLSIVTNVLDLISLILVTPKLFSIETRDNVRDLSILTLHSVTINKINIRSSTASYILGGTTLVLLYPLILLVLRQSLYQFSQLIALGEALNKKLHSSFLRYINQHMIETQMVFTKMWPFTVSVTIVSAVLAASVILLSALAKVSPEAQKKLEDMLLCCGLALFAYSRALSMMG